MAAVKRKYPKEEFARRGDEIYHTQVRPHLDESYRGKFAAIDIETGEYEIADDEMEAVNKLRARIPAAQTWMVRIGYRAVHRFGGRDQREPI